MKYKGGSRSQTRSQNGKPAASYSDGPPKTKGVVWPPQCPMFTLRVAAELAQSQIIEAPAAVGDCGRPWPPWSTSSSTLAADDQLRSAAPGDSYCGGVPAATGEARP